MRLRNRQRGSAYVLTLLALLVITLVGLSLSMVTQTEKQLGVNERMTQRVFYAANSGTAAATARVLARNDHTGLELLFNKTEESGLSMAERVRTSRFHPILASPCNFCEINQGSQYYNVNHAITAEAERIGWMGGGDPPVAPSVVARKTVGEMVGLQPWQVSLAEGVLPSLEDDELKKIRF